MGRALQVCKRPISLKENEIFTHDQSENDYILYTVLLVNIQVLLNYMTYQYQCINLGQYNDSVCYN